MAFKPKIYLYSAVEHWLASRSGKRLIEQALQEAGATPLEKLMISEDDFADCIENFQCDVHSHLSDRGWEVEFARHPQIHGIGAIYYYATPADKTFDPQTVFKAVRAAVEESRLYALPLFTQHAKRLLEGLRGAEASANKAAEAKAAETSIRLLREAVELLTDLEKLPCVFTEPTRKIRDFLAKVAKP